MALGAVREAAEVPFQFLDASIRRKIAQAAVDYDALRTAFREIQHGERQSPESPETRTGLHFPADMGDY